MQHPQSAHPKAKMYKILKDVLEERTTGSRGTTSIKVGGRVRSKEAKKLVAKELGRGLEDLESKTLMDLKTGEIKTKKKKTPKEKTPAENALKDAKAYNNKLLHCMHVVCMCTVRIYRNINLRLKKLNTDLDQCLADLDTYKVQNSTELVPRRV